VDSATLGDSVAFQCGPALTSVCINQADPLDSKFAVGGTGLIGIFGLATSPTGDNTGVWGQTASSGNRTTGVFGVATSTTGSTTGVWGRTNSLSDGSTGVFGEALGASGATFGVWGRTSSPSDNSAGVFGSVVDGARTSGVRGVSSALNGNGVIGEANNGDQAYGIWGKSTTGFAGAFDGKVKVSGTLSANVVQIGGADFSERFEVRRGESKVEPGMVVAIDPANPGKLAVSAKPYDRRVVGILSGAGGIRTGMLMGQPGTLADGDEPVALSGRVYVWADASNGAISVGDLLTTSSVWLADLRCQPPRARHHVLRPRRRPRTADLPSQRMEDLRPFRLRLPHRAVVPAGHGPTGVCQFELHRGPWGGWRPRAGDDGQSLHHRLQSKFCGANGWGGPSAGRDLRRARRDGETLAPDDLTGSRRHRDNPAGGFVGR